MTNDIYSWEYMKALHGLTGPQQGAILAGGVAIIRNGVTVELRPVKIDGIIMIKERIV
jgi:hypothetical protein